MSAITRSLTAWKDYRKKRLKGIISIPEDIAPNLAMGVTVLHATAIVVPFAAGFILNYVGYQIPFLIACGFAVVTFFVTLRLDPVKQRCAARLAADNACAPPEVERASRPA